jgi:hypothetical protein
VQGADGERAPAGLAEELPRESLELLERQRFRLAGITLFEPLRKAARASRVTASIPFSARSSVMSVMS